MKSNDGSAAMSEEFAGITALVTGGASGIGAAVVARLLEQGAQVGILDLNVEGANSSAFTVRADVSDDRSVREAVETVASHFGGIDVVVNNAGIGAQGTIEANPDSEWARVFDINVLGMVRVARAALPFLRRSTAASIVNTCSIAATAGVPERALYSASKGAVLSLTRAMAADHLREGIRVNCVNPGTADTPWIGRLLSAAPDPAAEREALNARQPHGRLVLPDEIADAILYLASPRSRSTTGTSLAVDGGMHELRLRAGQA
jgi:NAD(P)-dependent dehydrogenase (short-subunit alcohol dehydrogenase family)